MVLLSAALLVLMPAVSAQAANGDYHNTYVNTGNQRKDLVGVAMTQVGYREGKNNDTKYGSWYGLPNQPWCAMFISWCAKQADISSSILQRSAWAGPNKVRGFNIPCYAPGEKKPQEGDLFFTDTFAHVGIIYGVDGEYVLTIEGNSNNDGSDDGYGVVLNKRLISEVYIGKPKYEGCDKNHTYVRKSDKAHPHASYYSCTTCGDKYYTGSNAHRLDCATCMRCGCSEDEAGFYRVTSSGRLSVRTGHSVNSARLDYLESGESVYVLATNGSWAHIIDFNTAGYVDMRYLKKYVPTPTGLKTDAKSYYTGDTAKITWNETQTATNYLVTVSRDGKLLLEKKTGGKTAYQLTDLEPGTYTVKLTAFNAALPSKEVSRSFKVLKKYTVTFDAMGGENAPQPQTKYEDKSFKLSEQIPTRDGYVFLGWSDSSKAKCANVFPGKAWNGTKDVTLYAVWSREDAVPQKLKIHTPADKQIYVVGQSLDTTGMVLKLTYSDGASLLVHKGFKTSGFSSETAGTTQVTLTYKGVSLVWTLEILQYLPGDIDMNMVVDKEDVMALLWHITFPEENPIEVPADFTGDGKVNKDDVMQLLWHITFPDMYPIQ